jgi:hypothetical protein
VNDPHAFAIMLRAIRDHTPDGRRCSMSIEVDAASLEKLIRVFGEEVGISRGYMCKPAGSEMWVSISSERMSQLSFFHLYCPFTPAVEARLTNLLASAHCQQCKTYVGFDCFDHCVDTYCADCYPHRHIEVEDRDPSDAELITDEATA